jgi:hypothetical protein
MAPLRLCAAAPTVTFFPRHTVEIQFEEPPAFRRFSRSLVEMALLTGVLIRLFRALVLTHGSQSWVYVGGTFALGMIVVLGMVTAHLANYPLHQWLWRTAAFAGLELAAELVTSVVLIAAGREAIGSVRAHFGDLPSLMFRTFLVRSVAIGLWAAVLAGIIHIVRRNRLVAVEDDPVIEDPPVP